MGGVKGGLDRLQGNRILGSVVLNIRLGSE